MTYMYNEYKMIWFGTIIYRYYLVVYKCKIFTYNFALL